MSQPNQFFRLVARVMLVLMLGTPFLNSLPARAATSHVVIGEVAWAGSSLSTADEWLELWNLDQAPANIGGWSLAGAGESGKTITLPANATIPALGVYLISNYAANDPKSVLTVSPDVVTTTVSLPNSQLKIQLFASDGSLVDTAGTGVGNPPAGSSGTPKASMIRTLDADGNPTGWVSATTAQNLTGGVSDLATPGVCDGCLFMAQAPTNPPTNTASSGENTSSTDATPTTPNPTPPSITASSTTTDPVSDPSADDTTIVISATSSTSDTDALAALIPTSTSQTDTATSTTTGTPTAATDETAQDAASSTQATDANAPAAVSSTILPTDDAAANASTPPPKPPFAMLRLSEIYPAPDTDGHEWIEIENLDASTPVPLAGFVIRNGKKQIAALTSGVIDPTVSRYAVIEFTSGHLTNDGDTVSLYDPNGTLVDSQSYGSTPHDESWIRLPQDNTVWQLTLMPTPGADNILIAPPQKSSAATTSSTSTTVSTAPAVTSSLAATGTVTSVDQALTGDAGFILSDGSSLGSTTTLAGLQAELKSSKTAEAAMVGAATTTKTAAKKPAKTTTAKKTGTAKSSTAIIPMTLPIEWSEDLLNVRVRVRGVVGTPPGLISSHAFILMSPDGHGLHVSFPATRPLPDATHELELVGTLHFDANNQPELSVGAKDEVVEVAANSNEVAPRVVDLLDPDPEDAWSLVSVTGTAVSATADKIELDASGVDVDAVIRPHVGYDGKHTKKGDTVAVTGIADLRGATPIILPRTADDIRIIAFAPDLQAAAATSSPNVPSVPPWTPIGAAAGALGANEGVKRFRGWVAQRALERKSKQALAAIAK